MGGGEGREEGHPIHVASVDPAEGLTIQLVPPSTPPLRRRNTFASPTNCRGRAVGPKHECDKVHSSEGRVCGNRWGSMGRRSSVVDFLPNILLNKLDGSDVGGEMDMESESDVEDTAAPPENEPRPHLLARLSTSASSPCLILPMLKTGRPSPTSSSKTQRPPTPSSPPPFHIPIPSQELATPPRHAPTYFNKRDGSVASPACRSLFSHDTTPPCVILSPPPVGPMGLSPPSSACGSSVGSRSRSPSPARAPLSFPSVDSFYGAVMFVDVCGFTPLTEKFTRLGHAGLEILVAKLNEFFSQIIHVALDRGGDLVKFAGDGLLFVWRSEDKASLPLVTLQAVSCALELVAIRVHELEVRSHVSAGRLLFSILGGFSDQWEFLLTGQALESLATAGCTAGAQPLPRGVMVPAETWPHIREMCEGYAVAGVPGLIRVTHSKFVTSINEKIGPLLVPAIHRRRASFGGSSSPNAPDPNDFLDRVGPAAARFLPRRHESDHHEEDHSLWTACEMRRAAIMAIQLGSGSGREWSSQTTLLHKLQEAVLHVQHVTDDFGGSVLNFLMDDKGVHFILAWGLPQCTHTDDPARVVNAALAMRETLSEMGYAFGVGVCIGSVFCGTYGGVGRATYTALGDPVNTSARLAACLTSKILCDSVTHRATEDFVIYQPLGPISVKGKQMDIRVFEPVAKKPPPSLSVETNELIFGREAEQSCLQQGIEDLASGARPTTSSVLIEGEDGMGKSTLLRLAANMGASHHLLVLRAAAVPGHSAPLYVWRSLLPPLLDVPRTPTRAQWEEAITHVLPEAHMHSAVCFLASLLSTPELANTLFLVVNPKESTRAVEAIATIVRRRATVARRMVIQVDDAQWIDELASTAFMGLVEDPSPHCVLHFAYKPSLDGVPFGRVAALPGHTRLTLTSLREKDVLSILRSRVSASSPMTPDMAAVVTEVTQGNPRVAVELASRRSSTPQTPMIHSSSRRSSTPSRSDGCRVRSSSAQHSHTVMAAVLARFDDLSPRQQMLLKVASVIGARFSPHVLMAVMPSSDDTTPLEVEDLMAELSVLPGLFLVPDDNEDGEDEDKDSSGKTRVRFSFRHEMVRQACVSLMLVDQRAELHRRIAAWYEDENNDSENMFETEGSRAAFVADHWEAGERPERAIRFLLQGAEVALAQGHYYEGQQALQHYQTMITKFQPHLDNGTRSRGHRLIATCKTILGEREDAYPHLISALRALACTSPPRGPSLWFHVVSECADQLDRILPHRTSNNAALSTVQATAVLAKSFVRIRTWWSGLDATLTSHQARQQQQAIIRVPGGNAAVEMCRCHVLWSFLSLLEGDKVTTLFHLMRALNLAELGGESTRGDRIRCFAAAVLIAPLLGLRWLRPLFMWRAVRYLSTDGRALERAVRHARLLLGIADVANGNTSGGTAMLRLCAAASRGRHQDASVGMEAFVHLALTALANGDMTTAAMLWGEVQASERLSLGAAPEQMMTATATATSQLGFALCDLLLRDEAQNARARVCEWAYGSTTPVASLVPCQVLLRNAVCVWAEATGGGSLEEAMEAAIRAGKELASAACICLYPACWGVFLLACFYCGLWEAKTEVEERKPRPRWPPVFLLPLYKAAETTLPLAKIQERARAFTLTLSNMSKTFPLHEGLWMLMAARIARLEGRQNEGEEILSQCSHKKGPEGQWATHLLHLWSSIIA